MDSKKSEKILNLNINNIYDELKKPIKENFSEYQGNATSIEDIVKAINTNLANITAIQNYSNKINNLNSEALIKKEELLKLENEDLMKQLRELESIQSTIYNKERIIEQNNASMKQEDINIRVLISCIVLAILLLISISLYGTGKLDSKKLGIVVSIIVVLYIIVFLYAYNIFYFRTAIEILSYRKRERLIGSVREWRENVRNDIKEKLYGTESEWINNNCACPTTYGEDEEDIYSNDPNVSSIEIPGYMYYDGTAPQQILVPSPDTIQTYSQVGDKTFKTDTQIDWVDYSPNGNNSYNPSTNITRNNNNNFYNYKNTTDPTVLLLKELDKSDTLVNHTTKTANI